MRLLESRRNRDIVAVVIIVFFAILFHAPYLNEFPSHTHAWTQSDRFAITQGFVNNGLNFFKPETYLLNPPDPVNPNFSGKYYKENSITSVDFPIHDYIPAVAMTIDGSRAPWHSRMYVLLYSIVGLFFLYRLSYLLCGNYWKSLLTLLFALSSPVFIYYQSGFLPSIPSLANAIIGIYFYVLFLNHSRQRSFHFSLLFLSLATLSRSTFAIPLVAVFCNELLRIYKRETPLKTKILPVTISVLTILAYYFYNKYLQTHYGTIFLQVLLPPDNIQEMKEIVFSVFKTWKTTYFSKYHYLLLGLTLLCYLLLSKNRTIKVRIQHSQLVQRFVVLSLIVFLGALLFAILMMKQYTHHDYYFLDTFYLPLLFFWISLLAMLPELKDRREKMLTTVIVILFSSAVGVNGVKFQKNRRVTGSWDRIEMTINNYMDSQVLLDEEGVSDTARILAIDTYAPNIPFIFMERKGYGLNSTRRARIIGAMEREFEYITVQNELFVSDIYSEYPEILDRIRKVADNGSISLCVLCDTMVGQSLHAFLGVDGKNPSFETMMTYESIPMEGWQNVDTSSEYVYAGDYSGILLPGVKYGITYKTKSLAILEEHSSLVVFHGAFCSDTSVDCNVTVVLNEAGENVYFKEFNLKKLLSLEGEWEEIELTFQLPRVCDDDYEFALFMHNSGGGLWRVDDFGFEMY